jgi:hypothetical protein
VPGQASILSSRGDDCGGEEGMVLGIDQNTCVGHRDLDATHARVADAGGDLFPAPAAMPLVDIEWQAALCRCGEGEVVFDVHADQSPAHDHPRVRVLAHGIDQAHVDEEDGGLDIGGHLGALGHGGRRRGSLRGDGLFLPRDLDQGAMRLEEAGIGRCPRLIGLGEGWQDRGGGR